MNYLKYLSSQPNYSLVEAADDMAINYYSQCIQNAWFSRFWNEIVSFHEQITTLTLYLSFYVNYLTTNHGIELGC